MAGTINENNGRQVPLNLQQFAAPAAEADAMEPPAKPNDPQHTTRDLASNDTRSSSKEHRPAESFLHPLKRLLASKPSTAPGTPTGMAHEGPILECPRPITPARTISAPACTSSHFCSLREKYGRPRVFLGSGANGNCYTVTRLEDNKVFAIKAFRSRHRGESEKAYMKKLSSEFCIGSMLHHPNVVETHDLILDKDHAYEVLELCPNGDLYTFIQRSAPLAMSKVTSIFVQLIHGVAYLHSTGVVHRDLKPENCLFDKDGTLKIIDFGSADVWHLPFEEPGKCRMSTGRCGSGPYIAPEEWLTNQGYDGRKVDVWACAIIFMALAVRRFPWSLSANSDPDYARYKKYTEKPQSDNLPKIFTALKPEPDGPRNLILKMLEPNPNKRISIEEVMKDPWFIEVEKEEVARQGHAAASVSVSSTTATDQSVDGKVEAKNERVSDGKVDQTQLTNAQGAKTMCSPNISPTATMRVNPSAA